MGLTRGEKREQKRRAEKRMGMDGKSCILLQGIVARRAEEAKKKGA